MNIEYRLGEIAITDASSLEIIKNSVGEFECYIKSPRM